MPKQNHFVMAEIGPLVEAGGTSRCRGLLVWLFLEYRWRITRRRWVSVSNVELAKWGVGREAKRTALRRLEAAGLIQIEQSGRQSPRVSRG
jgi:hypothetical protein